MTSITIKVPEALKEELETQARIRGKSRSSIVRESLNRELMETKRKNENKPTVLDMLRDLAGKGDSGIPDLATNPKYMKGFGE